MWGGGWSVRKADRSTQIKRGIAQPCEITIPNCWKDGIAGGLNSLQPTSRKFVPLCWHEYLHR